MLLLLVFVSFGLANGIFIIRDELEKYTRVASSTDGVPCLGGCSPSTNECVVNWLWIKKPCQSSSEPAPIFYTSQVKDKTSTICLSNCGKFGFTYEWCVTTKDNKWDYCSSQVRGAVPSKSKSYVDSFTKENQLCQSPCKNDDSKKGYWCQLKSIFWNYCAKQALSRVPTLPSDFAIGICNEQNCDAFLTNLISDDFRANVSNFDREFAPDGYIQEVAETIETAVKLAPETGLHKTENGLNGAIKSYTMVNVVLLNGTSVLVPAVIRAVVSNSTIRRNQPLIDIRIMLDRNPIQKVRRQVSYDDMGYFDWRIIGYELGGSDEDYNFVRQSPNLYESWLQLQRGIVKWCGDTGGSVEVTVVTFYPNSHNTLPRALGVSLKFNNPNGSAFVTCKNTILWNK